MYGRDICFSQKYMLKPSSLLTATNTPYYIGYLHVLRRWFNVFKIFLASPLCLYKPVSKSISTSTDCPYDSVPYFLVNTEVKATYFLRFGIKNEYYDHYRKITTTKQKRSTDVRHCRGVSSSTYPTNKHIHIHRYKSGTSNLEIIVEINIHAIKINTYHIILHHLAIFIIMWPFFVSYCPDNWQ